MSRRRVAARKEEYDKRYELLELETFVDHLRETSDETLKGLVEIKQKNRTKLCLSLIIRMCQFCRVDFHSYYKDRKLINTWTQVDSRKHKTQPAADAKTTRAGHWWPLIPVLCYVYIFTKMYLNVYFQYIYDYHLFRLRSVQESKSRNENSMDQLTVSSWYLRAKERDELTKMSSAMAKLVWLGAPFYKSSYFVELAYQYLVYVTFITYGTGQIYYNLISALDFRLARSLLYPLLEHANHMKLVCDEVNKFIISSRNFHLNDYDESLDTNFYEAEETSTTITSGETFESGACLKQLRRLALNDQLRPLNWSSDWIEQLCLYYNKFTISCATWASLMMTVFSLMLPQVVEFDYHHWSSSDILMFIENIVIIFYLNIAVTFYVSVLFVSCVDYILYVNKLRLLIDERSRQNQLKYIKMVSSSVESKPSWPSYASGTNQRLISTELRLKTMNCNLLYCLMHYKIFVAQDKRHRESFQSLAFHSIIVWFVLPIMSRLHEPYVVENAKILQVWICLGSCFFINCVLVPICYLHNSSHKLYKSLCSLLAHTIETRTIGGNSGQHNNKLCWTPEAKTDLINSYGCGATFYDDNLVCLLRKELNNPDLFTQKFASVTLGIHLTYPNLVLVHFWYGIILLSLILGVSARADSIFGGFLSDPFGLFG